MALSVSYPGVMGPLPAPEPAPPPADLPVDTARVRSLCEALTPEPGVQLEDLVPAVGDAPLGEGWDNVLWPVGTVRGEAVVLRVVRRASALPLLRREVAVLRHLASIAEPLPMRIPAPLATKEDATLIPWLPGRTAAEVDDWARAATAHRLARMLATVHSLPAPRIDGNPVRGVPLATRSQAFRRDIELPGVDEATRRRALRAWDRGSDAPEWDRPAVLMHGDPHPGNVVVPAVGDEGDASLIDWGDTTTGDPASDLGGLLLHDPSDAVLATYRSVAIWPGVEDDARWSALVDRSWAWGVRLALALLTAYPEGHSLGRAGRRLLEARP